MLSLLEKFPALAQEADGWDPSLYSYGSKQKKKWICSKGHTWSAAISNRTSRKSGCPYCSGRLPITGETDLLTLFPEIASQADGWNPSLYAAFSSKNQKWKCSNGHQWPARISDRTYKRRGCPYCNKSKLMNGINDLASQYPHIAAEAYGWDPALVKYGSKQLKQWICGNGHIYKATINHRTSMGSGCPHCANYGFKTSREAWFYLMQNEQAQQIGITNSPKTRIKCHERNGWQLVQLSGPASGAIVFELEKQIKTWLKRNSLLINGTHENWAIDKLKISSIREIAFLAGVDSLVLDQLS